MTVAIGTAALDERSRYLRSTIVDALSAGRGHVGSAMSLVEILRVLYDEVLNVRPEQPDWPDRDRLLLSKGHGCLALYALLADHGFISREELLVQCKAGALLGGHPSRKIPGVEASTGALGHGLSLGVGMALAARMRGRPSRVFVITGDGEIDEGSIWEAAMTAAKHHLDNLTAIIDYNKLQSYGKVDEILPLEPLGDKWRAFGFGVRELDGHHVDALREAFASLPFEKGKPSVVIAHTVKGRGIDIAEGNPNWHHKSSLDEKAIADLRLALERL
jgi:transketolase